MVTGITIHPENPLEFDFIIGSGDDRLEGAAFEQESTRLIKYFLAALTVPEEEMWVNLSPYEEDRIIPNGFGDTEMGRDLLAQDYILKQLTASLMYPENELGEQFWTKVRAKAYEKFGTTKIPMNTFNKIWIIPEEAVVYEHGESAFVVKSHLKVMMEEDYVALQKNIGAEKYGLDSIVEDDAEVISGISSEVVREVLIPEIEKEVNQGETFANLRQIYNSVILAAWYKQNLKDSLLGQVYVGKNKTAGVDTEDKQANQKIYDQYVAAFKKGVYNYIKEDYDPATQEIIPRKYFSGGADLTRLTINDLLKTLRSKNFEELDEADRQVIAHFSDSGLGTYATNVNLVEIAEGKTAEEVSEIAKPAKTSSPITEKKSKKKTFKISGRDKLDAYQFIVNFYQDSPQITIKLKEILKSMGTLMSSSDPVTFSVDLASGNKLTRYDIVSIVKDVIDSYSSDPKYLRVLDNPSGRRTYMEETMGPLIRHILLTATTGSSPITGKEPETRVSGKDKHNVYGYDVSFRQDDSEVTIKLAKTSEPSSDSTTFTIKRATGNTLTPSDVASILENVIKVYSFAPGYLIAQEHVEELKYMTTKIAKILKMVTTIASQEHADYMPSTDKFGLYNFDVNFHPSDCEITIKLTKTSEMKISGFLPTGETFIVKRAPDNKLTSSDIASIVAKIIEAYSSDPDYLSKGFHLRGQRRYMEQKIVSILEMVTTVSSSITDAAVQNDFITMDDIGLYGKRVLIRPDINAPVKDGRIGLTERIIAASETIGETADRNAKVVVIAHQGRAGDADYVPLEQHAKLISKQIGRNVRYVNDLHGQEAQDAIRSLKNGDVLILHNVRPGENDPNFVADLEPLFDYFILDGFSVSHRDQPSVTGFKNIPNIAGRLMERELSGNLKFVSAITHPYVELLGGSKISDHINPLRYGLEEGLIDTVLTGGMLGQLLLLIEGYNLGEMTMKALRSQDVDAKKRPEGLLSLLPALEEIYRQYQDRFEIPVDLAYEDENGNRQEIMVKDLPKEGFAYLVGDNGTQTAQAYAEILKGAKTAFVKGPQGNYKNDNFRKSSKIALAGLSESDAFWMTGGGDTDAMVVQMGLTPSHRTLAGGAFLRFKTGQILVGVQQLKSSHERYDIEDAYKRVDSAEQSPSSPVTAETLIIETDT
ncbi:MAG: phosphoglycerate kinase, partial [Candidatus Omnitrophica bacterium]|nr:phosphoglycerate kinase [Candidatus Omnitrophota bacterium]